MDEVTGAPEPEPQPEDPESWAGPSRDEWNSVNETLQGLQPFLEYLNNPEEQTQEAPQEQPGLDPFSDDFESRLTQLIESKLAPISQYTEQSQLAEAEERALDIIHDITTREGEFLSPEGVQMARARAETHLPEAQQKFGFGPRAAEAAIEKAVNEVRAYEKAVGEAYYNQKSNQMSNLAGARREPPAAGQTGATQRSLPEGRGERSVVEAYFPTSRGA